MPSNRSLSSQRQNVQPTSVPGFLLSDQTYTVSDGCCFAYFCFEGFSIEDHWQWGEYLQRIHWVSHGAGPVAQNPAGIQAVTLYERRNWKKSGRFLEVIIICYFKWLIQVVARKQTAETTAGFIPNTARFYDLKEKQALKGISLTLLVSAFVSVWDEGNNRAMGEEENSRLRGMLESRGQANRVSVQDQCWINEVMKKLVLAGQNVIEARGVTAALHSREHLQSLMKL